MTLPLFSLVGKNALVTGGSQGLGLEIAKALAQSGADVMVNSRHPTTLDQVVADINQHHGSALPLAFDIADQDAVQKAFEQIQTEYGRLDILVNTVGMCDRRPLPDFSMDDVRQLIEVDLIAPFNLCRQATPLMIPQKEGRIINLTSIVGSIAGPGDAVYTIAKGGLESLTRTFAAELGGHNITVNGVAPGFFATASNKDVVGDPDIHVWLQKRTSLGRWGKPQEIAGAVVFLASPAAAYITGQILAVDGGYLTHL